MGPKEYDRRCVLFSKNASFDSVFWDKKCAIWKRAKKKKKKKSLQAGSGAYNSSGPVF